MLKHKQMTTILREILQPYHIKVPTKEDSIVKHSLSWQKQCNYSAKTKPLTSRSTMC